MPFAALPLVECKEDVLDAALGAFAVFGGISGLFVGFVALVTLFSQPPSFAARARAARPAVGSRA